MNEEQLERYSRHVLLPQIGEPGQQRLLAARVFIIGAGVHR
jgi:molybdopterin/thiamine biosynthesis adenylyltransferase